jgi:hypothetical protein
MKLRRFRVGELALDNAVYAAAARATPETSAERSQIVGRAGGDHLDLALLGVADPSAQVELVGLAMNKPAKTYPLYPASNKKVKNHIL